MIDIEATVQSMVQPNRQPLDRLRWLVHHVLPKSARLYNALPTPSIVSWHIKDFSQSVRDYALWWITHPDPATYDLVFAVARNAIESMATGCAVVVVDDRGLGGMVRSERVDVWRQQNFGKRLLTRAPTREALVKEILSFDPDDATAVCQRIREVASLDHYVLDLVRMYEAVVAENRMRPLDERFVLDAFPSAFCNAIPELMQLMSDNEIQQFSDSLPFHPSPTGVVQLRN